jgi:hypothetical protein
MEDVGGIEMLTNQLKGIIEEIDKRFGFTRV